MCTRILFIFTLFCSITIYSQNNDVIASNDSIAILQDLSKNTALDFQARLSYARRAVLKAKETKEDSIILKSKRNLSTLFLREGLYDSIKNLNISNLKLANKIKDTLAMAHAGYNLGFYYDYNLKYDSAYYYYYHSMKWFKSKKDQKNEADLLLNMANIQETERDFIGSELNAINAIKILKTFPSNDDNNYSLWSLHNLIGILSNELKLYDKSLEYHKKALDYASKIQDNYQENLYSNYNIAWVYKEQEDYVKAISKFNEMLKDKELKEKDPSTYSTILSSIAYCRFLNKDIDSGAIKELFNTSLKVIEGTDEKVVAMVTYQYFSEYYDSLGKKDSALHFASKAYNIGKELKDNETILKTLVLKSKLESGEASKKYLLEHIKLNDSLVFKERSARNKFARIEFETDEIKAENEQISRERLLFLILSIGLFMTLTLIYIIITQRSKNKELKFIQQQQETNEEIYNLMLSQQDQIEEARTLEKRRISEELHDGILGRLFGTRLSLDSLNMSNTEEAIKSRENYIDELQAIEQEIRKVSHELNTDFVSGSGFSDIIKSLLETQTKAYKLRYLFSNDDSIHWDAINNKTKIHIYRILQESLQNIYKHANASHVEISFNLKNNVICIKISDDGSGFDVNKSKKGIGVKNITSRVNEINGELNIQSKINKGTSIIISVPI